MAEKLPHAGPQPTGSESRQTTEQAHRRAAILGFDELMLLRSLYAMLDPSRMAAREQPAPGVGILIC